MESTGAEGIKACSAGRDFVLFFIELNETPVKDSYAYNNNKISTVRV